MDSSRVKASSKDCQTCLTSALLIQFLPAIAFISSCHLGHGRPLRSPPLVPCGLSHVVSVCVHLSSVYIATWLAHLRFSF